MNGQRAIVEVRWAKVPVRKAVIDPGGRLRVGHSERADLAIPDRTMSAVHCELQWDGQRCRVVGRSRQAPIFINGKEATEGDVGHGGWVRAGTTVLSIYFEGATPPRSESGLRGDGTDALSPLQSEVSRQLREAKPSLFAVLDAARTLRVIEVMRDSVEEYRTLYEGIKGEAMAMEAPYLVRLPHGARVLDQLVLEGWGKRWGIYLTSSRPFDEVRTHLRRLLLVDNDDSGNQMYFRFYDPQILRLFLPTCSARQKEQIFGEIEAFLVEGRQGELLRLTAREAPAMVTQPPVEPVIAEL